MLRVRCKGSLGGRDGECQNGMPVEPPISGAVVMGVGAVAGAFGESIRSQALRFESEGTLTVRTSTFAIETPLEVGRKNPIQAPVLLVCPSPRHAKTVPLTCKKLILEVPTGVNNAKGSYIMRNGKLCNW